MFMLRNEDIIVIVFAPYEKVADVLRDLRCDGSARSVTKILQAMESISTYDEGVVNAAQKCCMACGGEWFTLSYQPDEGAWHGECLTPDIMTGGYELREVMESCERSALIECLQSMK